MVRVEFKSPLFTGNGFLRIKFMEPFELRIFRNRLNKDSENFIISVTPYMPTADPYLDLSFILEQLGISKEQDEVNQKEYEQ